MLGAAVEAFVTGLDHPRWLYVLPNGDVLVAEPNAPPSPDNNKGIKGWFLKYFQIDGSKLYVSVGSNSNVAERGISNEEGGAAIWEVDLESGSHRIFALGWQPCGPRDGPPVGVAIDKRGHCSWPTTGGHGVGDSPCRIPVIGARLLQSGDIYPPS